MEPSEPVQTDNIQSSTDVSQEKMVKNTKGNRYYYRHREDILEKLRQKKEEDPEYQEIGRAHV